MDVTENEILAFLRSIESGDVALVPQEEPQSVYAGAVDYVASNGWTVAIYNDANEWDYVEHIRTADGRECDYDAIFASMPAVDAYRPSADVAWSRYRIPGHLKFRCTQCGQPLIDHSTSYVCPNCKPRQVA